LLFNTLIAFTALFVMAFALMNQNKKMPDVKGAYIITVTWDENFDDDVDTYVLDPEGKLVFFQRREDGLMHLDRDDLGKRNDTVSTQFGQIVYKENREIVTLRGTSRGEYVVNVHLYRRNDAQNTKPIEVTIQLDKISPTYTPIIQKKVILLNNGDEKTGFRFVVNDKGEVTSTSFDYKSLANAAQGQNLPVDPDLGRDRPDDFDPNIPPKDE
jgi:transcriptional regulator of met regulon